MICLIYIIFRGGHQNNVIEISPNTNQTRKQVGNEHQEYMLL